MPSAPALSSKPSYAVMVTESIKALGNRTASSVPAIKKQIGMQYKIDAGKINQKALTNAIKKLVESGDFVQIKASYKLGKKATTVKKPPSTTVKKSSTTKPATKKKSTTTTKKVTTKPSSSKTRKTSTTKTVSKVKSLKPKKSIAKKTAKDVKKVKTSKKKTSSKN